MSGQEHKNWSGGKQQGSKDLDHSIFREESVESTTNSRFELQVGQIRKSTSTLNSANRPAQALEQSPLSAEFIIDSGAHGALLQLAIPNQNLKVMRYIGEGGQGDSYLLVNEEGKQFKAKILKEVPKEALYCSADELADYLPEVKYFSRLDIPGVAKVIGAYSVEDPNLERVVVVVSEYVEGETLQTKIRKLEPGQGLGVSETFNLLVKLSTSLATLHSDTHNGVRQRVVHGDLKPANIVLSESRDPTLIDFGSTKAVTPGNTAQFTMGTSSFSPPYSPLEQYLGKRIPASDVYALGVTAIECLLGRIPQELSEAVEKMQSFVVKPSATIPKPLAVILTKMVELRSDKRYQDGQALLTALRQAEESIVKNSALQAKPGLLVRGVQALWRGLSHAWRALGGEDGYTSGAATTTQIDNHQAVEGKITVNGQQLDTLLTEGSFNRTRNNQIAYARSLGYRLATRKEHLVYVEGLLAKERNNTINDAEKNALQTYRERYVRDTEGGLVVVGRRVRVNDDDWYALDDPDSGALFVRASAESK